MDETREATTLKDKLQRRIEELETNKKQVESHYIELVGSLSEVKRILQMLDAQESCEKT